MSIRARWMVPVDFTISLSAAIERHREASKILASRGLCAGVLVAGHIGTGAGATNAGHVNLGHVTCAPRPTTMPPASATIPATTGTPINLTLQSGVNVIIPAGSPGINAVNAANTGGVTAGAADITITADGVTINNTNNPLAVTRPDCEYSPAATPKLWQRTPQLM